MMKCRLACRSTRNSILPPLMSETALAGSGVTVPVFGFGIRPRGPRTRPRRPTLPIMSGVATTASNSSQPPLTFSISSSPPTMSAPASRAASAFSAFAKTSTRAVLPVPCGRLTVPRTIWSALRGSTPRHITTSTVSSNFFLRAVLGDLDRGQRGVELVLVERLGRRAVGLAALHDWFSSLPGVVGVGQRGPATVGCRSGAGSCPRFGWPTSRW